MSIWNGSWKGRIMRSIWRSRTLSDAPFIIETATIDCRSWEIGGTPAAVTMRMMLVARNARPAEVRAFAMGSSAEIV